MNITKEEAAALIELIRKTRDIEDMQMIVHAYEKMLAIAEGKEEPKSKGGRKSLDRQKIMDYFDKGRTEEQIAELVGCHRQTVRRILKETGKLDEAKLDTGKVIALHQAGWSVKDIAGEMGCSSQCIEKTLQEKDQNNESEML